MKIQFALAALVLSLAPGAFAQGRGNFNGQNGQNGGNRGGQNAGVLPLPKGINRLISIDAYNILLAETENSAGDRGYAPIIVRHVYSGGIAALFGGVSVPTAQFVSPGAQNGGGGGRNGGGRNGGGGFGVNGFGGGGNNGGGGNFNGGGNNFNGGGNNFNGGGQNFNGGGNFNQGFGNGVSGFNGTGFNQGFNGAGNGQPFQTPNGNIGVSQTSVVNPDGTQTPLANGPFFPQ